MPENKKPDVPADRQRNGFPLSTIRYPLSTALIVTARTDPETSDFFNRLRQMYFPPERNFLSAHITLFHHLPGERQAEIEDFLAATAAGQTQFPLHFPSLRFLSRGTAVEIESPELVRLRAALARQWGANLTPQDRNKFRPHITIQNKVPPEEARNLFDHLKTTWEPRHGTAAGLDLWHYRNGPWELARQFSFAPPPA